MNDANAENDRLKNLLNNQKPVEDKAVKEYVATPVSVFFNIGKSKVASKKELVIVLALAQYAKDNNAKLEVNGYADSATGSAAVNQKLSKARAEKVADELVKLGVAKENIVVKANGGVKDLTPASYSQSFSDIPTNNFLLEWLSLALGEQHHYFLLLHIVALQD